MKYLLSFFAILSICCRPDLCFAEDDYQRGENTYHHGGPTPYDSYDSNHGYNDAKDENERRLREYKEYHYGKSDDE